jgi:hypothetical protein
MAATSERAAAREKEPQTNLLGWVSGDWGGRGAEIPGSSEDVVVCCRANDCSRARYLEEVILMLWLRAGRVLGLTLDEAKVRRSFRLVEVTPTAASIVGWKTFIVHQLLV